MLENIMLVDAELHVIAPTHSVPTRLHRPLSGNLSVSGSCDSLCGPDEAKEGCQTAEHHDHGQGQNSEHSKQCNHEYPAGEGGGNREGRGRGVGGKREGRGREGGGKREGRGREGACQVYITET